MDEALYHVLKSVMIITSFAAVLGLGMYLSNKHRGDDKGGAQWVTVFYIVSRGKQVFGSPIKILCLGMVAIGLILWFMF